MADPQQCIFCGITSGSIPSKQIYKDSTVTVVLDIYPANPAHLLVLPNEHAVLMTQLPKETVEHLGSIAQKCCELIFKVVKAEGCNVFIANGPVAGQKAPHFIMHVIPRFKGDGLNFDTPEKDAETTKEQFAKLKETISNYFPDQKVEEIAAEDSPKEEKPEEKKEEKQKAPVEDKVDLDKLSNLFG